MQNVIFVLGALQQLVIARHVVFLVAKLFVLNAVLANTLLLTEKSVKIVQQSLVSVQAVRVTRLERLYVKNVVVHCFQI